MAGFFLLSLSMLLSPVDIQCGHLMWVQIRKQLLVGVGIYKLRTPKHLKDAPMT